MKNDFDLLKISIEAAMPNNTVLYDDKGNPSIMVRIPRFNICDVIEGGSGSVHPAFIVNGKVVPEIIVSKYSNVLIDGRAYSLPGQNPTSDISRDIIKQACESKGKGWHMMSNAEWAAIALWCKKNGFMPRGNNAFAKDVYFNHERGYVTYAYEKNNEIKEGKTATGSGPISWAHNNSPDGIYDMNGNVWAQVSGLRFVDGEIQIIPDNNSAAAVDESVESINWKAILSDGSLVTPGSDGTLKIDFISEKLTVSSNITNREDKWLDSFFKDVESNVNVPEILKSLALYPVDKSGYGEQKFWCNNTKERMPWRGGTWDAFSNSGIFCLFACYPRTHFSPWMGFRSAYIEL